MQVECHTGKLNQSNYLLLKINKLITHELLCSISQYMKICRVFDENPKNRHSPRFFGPFGPEPQRSQGATPQLHAKIAMCIKFGALSAAVGYSAPHERHLGAYWRAPRREGRIRRAHCSLSGALLRLCALQGRGLSHRGCAARLAATPRRAHARRHCLARQPWPPDDLGSFCRVARHTARPGRAADCLRRGPCQRMVRRRAPARPAARACSSSARIAAPRSRRH